MAILEYKTSTNALDGKYRPKRDERERECVCGGGCMSVFGRYCGVNNNPSEGRDKNRSHGRLIPCQRKML